MKLSNIICPVVRELVRGLKQHIKGGDNLLKGIAAKMAQRADAGFCKYGTTLARKDVTRLGWLKHAQEEALDLAAYLQAIQHHHGEDHSFTEMQSNVLAMATHLESYIQGEEAAKR